MAYALITGASSGIGRELAALFAADGHDLIITARRQSKLSEVKRTLERRYHVRVETVALDLSEPDAPRNLHDYTVSHGLTVDHLVNNAGFADWTGFLDADWHRQHEMMQLNMAALAELTYRYGRDMRGLGHGRILNISSVASMMAGPYMAMYFASKAFVRSLSEAVAYELRGTGVSVTCVSPRPDLHRFRQGREHERRELLHPDQTGHRTPTRRLCLPDDDAGAHARLSRVSHQGWGCGRTPAPPRVHPTGRRAHERRRPTTASSRMNTAACGNPRGFHAMRPFPVSLGTDATPFRPWHVPDGRNVSTGGTRASRCR